MVITAAVYGVVAGIVKMDDVGLRLAQRPGRSAAPRPLLVAGMPKLLAWLSVIGTAAMLWVGGHILLAGADELGWHGPYDLVHDLEHAVENVAGIGAVLAWSVNTLASAIVGLAVGSAITFIVARVPFRRARDEAPAH